MIRRMVLFLLAAMPVAYAQTNPSIFGRPWPQEPLWAQTRDEVFVHDRADTRGGTDAGIWSWDSTARVKLDKDSADPRFVLGYRMLSLTVDSDLPAINGTFWDIGLVAGGRVAQFENDWEISLLGGGGSANDGHFRDEEGLYGIGAVHVSRKISGDEEWMFGIAYDGHRLFLPDIPLPYASYRRKLNDQLIAVIGVPFGGALWRPRNQLTVDLQYRLPADLSGRVNWNFTKVFSAFAEYSRSEDAFAIDGVENRRLFFAARRVFGGVRWNVKLADISLGVGYAFDQEFERGFDVRNTRTVTQVDDAPFVMLRLDGKL